MFISTNSGTETVSALTAVGLRRAGHEVLLYAPRIGELAERMRTQGFQVYDRIADIKEMPDVIHAHHVTPTLIAMARFPNVPVVFTCHSSVFMVEAPIVHPQIKRWVAVDEACRRKSIACGVPEQKLSVIHNAVDLTRFIPRSVLPTKPVRGLMLTKNHHHQKVVREACLKMNIDLDELGPATGRVSDEIEKELIRYDVVFATARMAIEAASVGCAVVVCDARGFAGLLTCENMNNWRDWNLGVGLLSQQTNVENLIEAIGAYNSEDAFRVSEYFRSVVGLDKYTEAYLVVYQQAIDDHLKSANNDYALDNSRWIEELSVTIPERKWFNIATELGMIQKGNDQALLVSRFDAISDALQNYESMARIGQASAEQAVLQLNATNQSLQTLVEKVTEIERFNSQIKRFYHSILPTFIRKYLYKLRK
ncbi:glycosyltransferase [Brucella sp. NBRC 12950]|uniref:glycosyltransferase n=1 Tax=Brucella sp. NBRC 12950 TaxID=2994518 RepID=UPI0025566E79|nr:glycosyltransferase [Brucella sp. NBRC 12950]